MLVRFVVSNIRPWQVAEGLAAFKFAGGTLNEGQGWWTNDEGVVEYEPNVTAEVAFAAEKFDELLDCIQNMLALLHETAAYLVVLPGYDPVPSKTLPGAYLFYGESRQLVAIA